MNNFLIILLITAPAMVVLVYAIIRPRWVDRIISSSVFVQLRWFCGVIIAICIMLSAIAILCKIPLLPDSNSVLDQIQGVLYHFIDPGYLFEIKTGNAHIGNDSQTLATIIAFSGMVLFGGLLITTLTNIIDRRIDDLENGRVCYKSIKGHHVIIGYCEITIPLIESLFSDKNPNPVSQIIIQTNLDVPTVRASLFAKLPPNIEKKILIYAGDLESYEHLNNLNINSSIEFFILGDSGEYGRDSKNNGCAKYISTKCSKINNQTVINVLFDQLSTYSNLNKVSSNENLNAYIRPFNYYDNWAKLLWCHYLKDSKEYEPLDFAHLGDDDFVHLFIVGLNRMGEALLLQALKSSHYVNYDSTNKHNKTKITIIDKDMTEKLNSFRSRYPYIENQIYDINVEYMNNSIESDEVRQYIIDATNDNNQLITIAICIKDPDKSLSIGISLPDIVYYKAEDVKCENYHNYSIINSRNIPRVLIRQELSCGLANDISNDCTLTNKHIKTFGMFNKGMENFLYNDIYAQFVNSKYMDIYHDNIEIEIVLMR